MFRDECCREQATAGKGSQQPLAAGGPNICIADEATIQRHTRNFCLRPTSWRGCRARQMNSGSGVQVTARRLLSPMLTEVTGRPFQ